ncbi:hypothetical protein U1Q18_052292 [Sarracenia purpurea var. burkii]
MEKLIRERGAIKAQLIDNTKLSDSFLSNEAALNELSDTLDKFRRRIERVQDQIEVFLGPPDEGADDPQEIERENFEMTLLVLRAKIIQKRSEINHTPLKQGNSFVPTIVPAINSLIISQLRDAQYKDPSPAQPDSTSKLPPITNSNINVVPSTHTVNEVCFSSTKDLQTAHHQRRVCHSNHPSGFLKGKLHTRSLNHRRVVSSRYPINHTTRFTTTG